MPAIGDPSGPPPDRAPYGRSASSLLSTSRQAPRTRFFDQQVLDAIAAGISQVVICGAGYDDRGLRFRHPDVEFSDLGLPYVTAGKARRLEASGADMTRITLAPADFRADDVADVLEGCGHDAQRPSLFIAEHLLVFLEQHTTLPGQVVSTFSAQFFGDITPMPTILPRYAFLALLQDAGWRAEHPDEVNGVDHTDLMKTQFVSAVA